MSAPGSDPAGAALNRLAAAARFTTPPDGPGRPRTARD